MRKIHVGIAYEGSADIDALKITVQRVLNSCDLDFDLDAVYPQTPGSGIIGFVAAYAQRFAEEGVDLPIYCTDQDRDKKSRREIIVTKLRQASPVTADISAVGVSVPHFEAWLVADEDTVKSVLGLSGEEPLPLGHMQPKDRLLSLYQNNYEGDLSVPDVRCQIATKMNLNHLERTRNDFNLFVGDIKRAANIIKTRASTTTV